jgi:hypothetical protein
MDSKSPRHQSFSLANANAPAKLTPNFNLSPLKKHFTHQD